MTDPTEAPTDATPTTAYAAAGVSIEAGDRAVELMKGWVEKARRPEMIGGIGGFAGLFDASALKSYERPLLASSADGVGTKVAIAQALDKHDTIGFDLVGMLVDDLVVCGAEPLFLTDYIATGRVVPERIAAIVKGIAEACVEAGCALIGGETAEHPGLLEPDEYDVAGSTTGVVEADDLLGPGRVRPGDVVIAMEASGLHSNGYSLVRHVLLASARRRRAGRWTGTSTSWAARSARSCWSRPGSTPRPAWRSRRRPATHAMSHITGGGLAANLARVMPEELQRHHRPVHLDAAAGLRPGAPGGRRTPAGPGADPQLRRRDGRADRPRRRGPGGRGAGRVRRPGVGRGVRRERRRDRRAGRSAPRLVTISGSAGFVRRARNSVGRVCGNTHRTGSVALTRTDK